MAVKTIPFDAGQEQGIDKSLLSGRFSLVRNGVLSRDGQLRPRPAFTALAATAYGTGTFVAYDLASYNDRLIALGDVMGLGYPTDVAEYIEGAAAAWRPTVPSPVVPRLPRATLIRDLPQPPDQLEGVINWTCAAFGGFVCLAWNNGGASVRGYACVYKASTGQLISFQQFDAPSSAHAITLLRVVELGDRFIIIGRPNNTAQIFAERFIVGSDESWVDLGQLLPSGATAYTAIAAARAEGSTQFVTVTADSASGTLVTRRWSNVVANQVPSGGQYATITDGLGAVDKLEVHASSTDNRITIGAQTDGTLHLYTFNLSTGAAVGAGPFSPFSGFSVDEFAFCSSGTPNVIYVIGTFGITGGVTEPEVGIRTYNTNTNAFGTLKTLFGVRVASSPIVDGSELVFAVRCGPNTESQSNTLIAVNPTTFKASTPLINKDFEISTSRSGHIPALAKDASTGLWYWPNARLTTDGQATPLITEFTMNSNDRRQMCQVGSLMVIGGGVPVVYDGAQVAEDGFLNRPVIVSVTATAIGSGGLILSATYNYKLIWEALDSDDNITRSAVSAIVQYVATDDVALIVCETPLSMRANAGASEKGSVIRLKLYRTVAVEDRTFPTIVGTQPADPPIASVVGQFVGVYVFNGTTGAFHGTTFSALATNSVAIAAQIQANLAGQATADGSTGRIILTSLSGGANSFMFVYPDPAAVTLGLAPNSTQQGESIGTSVFTTGDVFHLCATRYPGIADEVGQRVTITDTMSDDTLRAQQIVYTQAENPLDHHASGPADLCSSGGEQIVVAGQPKRDRWTASKPFAASQGVQFANPGREKFSRRIRGDIQAIMQRDQEVVLWTRREIWSINGTGPDRAGKGDFQQQRLVYGQGGLLPLGWRSVINIADGTFFQLDGDKIYALSPGGAPTWIGHPVVETLALYPVIVAVCHVRQHQTLAFACQSSDGASGVILRYDLRRKQWFEDDVGPVDAMAEFNGQLAIVVAGTVFLQDLVFAHGSMPTLTAKLGSFTNFGSLGWGALTAFTLLGQFRGQCTVEMQVSFDDTVTWVTCGTYTLLTSDYAVGAPVELEFFPATQECSRFALQAIVTGTATDSGGVWLSALEIHDDPDEGPARKGQAFTR